MKQLILVRHAEAEDEDILRGIPDFKRSLTKKGERQAELAGKFLMQNHEIPDLILSSPAVRAYRTAAIIANEINYPQERIITDPIIYTDDENSIRERISTIDNSISNIIICGHNPSILLLSNLLNETKRNHFKKSYVLGLTLKINHWIDLFETQNGKQKFNFEPGN